MLAEHAPCAQQVCPYKVALTQQLNPHPPARPPPTLFASKARRIHKTMLSLDLATHSVAEANIGIQLSSH